MYNTPGASALRLAPGASQRIASTSGALSHALPRTQAVMPSSSAAVTVMFSPVRRPLASASADASNSRPVSGSVSGVRWTHTASGERA